MQDMNENIVSRNTDDGISFPRVAVFHTGVQQGARHWLSGRFKISRYKSLTNRAKMGMVFGDRWTDVGDKCSRSNSTTCTSFQAKTTPQPSTACGRPPPLPLNPHIDCSNQPWKIVCWMRIVQRTWRDWLQQLQTSRHFWNEQCVCGVSAFVQN